MLFFLIIYCLLFIYFIVIFFFFNVYRYKIYTLLTLVRFSQISKIYITVFAQLFFFLLKKQKRKTVYASDYIANNNVQHILNIFAASSVSKKDILIAVSLKKKSNIFKKYDSYKRSLFYESYSDLKETYFTTHRRRKYFKKFKTNFDFGDVLDRKIVAEHRNPNLIDNFLNTNYNFFKKITRNKSNLSFCFLRKKRYLYRMNRRFNKRFYANRLVFKNVFLPLKAKQFSITRFVENFKTHPTHNFYTQVQLFLFTILLSSQFFFFKSDCFFFLKKFGVFLNGKLCSNPYKVLMVGDVVQIPVTCSFFFFLKKFNNISIFFFRKYSSKFHKIYASKKKKYRTRSYYMPKWVNRLAYVSEDIPSFLEVDFSILSVIIVYNCNSLFDIHSGISNYILLYLYRTYNWRTLA